IEPGAQAGACAERACQQSVEEICESGNGKNHQRPSEIAVDDQDDENRDQQHADKRQLVGGRENTHFKALNSVSSRETASMASLPETERDNWNSPPSASGRMPADTEIDASAKFRLLTPTSAIFAWRLC